MTAEPPAVPPARGLLLDVGGVVLRPAPVVLERMARHDARVAGALEAVGGIGGPGDDLWARMLAHEVTERSYWSRRSAELAPHLGLPGNGTRDLMRMVYDGPDQDWLQQPVLALMADAKAAGLPLGALTNDMADFHGSAWVERQSWVKLFDVVVDASSTGVLKPDPRAFAAGARALGLAPADIVYIDDMPWNIDGGTAAGLRAVRLAHDDPGPAVAQARRLLGLPAAA